MKHFLDIDDIEDVGALVLEATKLKAHPYAHQTLGRHRTLGLFFFNASLRTRLSTQKAAKNLGMEVMVMNFSKDGWSLEFEEGAVMNGTSAEHIKEAAAVLSQYCDIIGVRAFGELQDREKDESEYILKNFGQHASVPVISLEGATAHPLQALADALTIAEHKRTDRPKVVLSWAPHPRALPHAVPNSFVKMMKRQEVELLITHPEGYELNKSITEGVSVIYDQNEALENADFVYVKNWSSYNDYGQILSKDPNWMTTQQKLSLTNHAYFMHCLPVRRNVVVEDAVLDSRASLTTQQAENRIYAAQAALKTLLQHGS